MTTHIAPRVRWLLGALALVLVVSGCAGPTFNSLPLPGTRVSGDTISLSAEFAEALNLTDGAQVRVNGVDSGRVQSVSVHDFRAKVDLKVKKSARLREGATARLRYTTPLGELFVDVTNPTTGTLLASGAKLGLTQTSTAPTVEDALSSASLLVNGGGLNQLKVITDESNALLDGRVGTIRDTLGRGTTVLKSLNESQADIDRTLTALNSVSTTLHERRDVIRQALTDIRPASRVIRANLDQITALLTQLRAFADTANSVVGATRTQVLQLIREAGPILQEMVADRLILPVALRALIRAGQIVSNVVPNDYLNLGVHLHLDSGTLGTGTPVGPVLPPIPVIPGLPNLPGLPSLPGLPGLTGTTSGSGSGGVLGGLLGGGQ